MVMSKMDKKHPEYLRNAVISNMKDLQEAIKWHKDQTIQKRIKLIEQANFLGLKINSETPENENLDTTTETS